MTDTDASAQRGPAAGPAEPADTPSVPAIGLDGVAKEFHSRGEVIAAVRGIDLTIRKGEFFSMLGPSGCGKTTTMRMIAGFEEPTRGRGPAARPRRTARPAEQARRQHGVPVLRAVPAHERVRERGLRAAPQERAQGRDHAASVGEMLGDRRPDRPRAAPAAGSCPAASSSVWRWPGPWSTTPGPAAGRAARRPRPQAPPGHAGRAQAHPARGRHHVRLRDARPGRGAHHVGPDRRDERRRDRAPRAAAGNL